LFVSGEWEWKVLTPISQRLPFKVTHLLQKRRKRFLAGAVPSPKWSLEKGKTFALGRDGEERLNPNALAEN